MVYNASVEKRKPTYDLEAFKSACGNVETLHITGVALRGAASLGLGRDDVAEIVGTMRRQHFYKSMTSYADHRVWQDVYHVPSRLGPLYIKFTTDAVTEFLLLSFKEKDDE
jgi:motility quorum-sensing regulator / GCU-specific mRNA interferase toxin